MSSEFDAAKLPTGHWKQTIAPTSDDEPVPHDKQLDGDVLPVRAFAVPFAQEAHFLQFTKQSGAPAALTQAP